MLLIAAIISRLLRTDKYRTIQNCKIAMTQDASKHAISNFHIFSFHRSSSHHNAHTASRFPRLRGQMLFRLFLYDRLLIENLCRNFVGMRIALRKERKKERRSTLNIYTGEDLRIEEKIKNNKIYTKYKTCLKKFDTRVILQHKISLKKNLFRTRIGL